MKVANSYACSVPQRGPKVTPGRVRKTSAFRESGIIPWTIRREISLQGVLSQYTGNNSNEYIPEPSGLLYFILSAFLLPLNARIKQLRQVFTTSEGSNRSGSHRLC
jgi:hypothetical protein